MPCVRWRVQSVVHHARSCRQVLQLVITTQDMHLEPNGNDLWGTLLTGVSATAVSGFVLAVCMMFSFRQMVDASLMSYRKTNKGVSEASPLPAEPTNQLALPAATWHAGLHATPLGAPLPR